jgi:hypothetical protein
MPLFLQLNNFDMFYTNHKSSNDYNVEYGGVIYIYNDLHIKLAFPYRSGGSETYNTGGVVFTGMFVEYYERESDCQQFNQ